MNSGNKQLPETVESPAVFGNLTFGDLSPLLVLGPAAFVCHKQAKQMGWWDEQRNVGELLMLVVTELSEALEARRKGTKLGAQFSTEGLSQLISGLRVRDPEAVSYFATKVKDTFEDEIADAFIRLLGLCEGLGIGEVIGYHVAAKLLYNRTRDKKHGKQF